MLGPRLRAARRSLRVRVVLLAAGVFALALLAVALRPDGTTVAVWWPASALAVGVVALAAPRERAVMTAAVLVGSALANAVGGRPPAASLCFGVANAAEAWTVAWLFTRPTGGVARFRSVEDGLRLLLAAVLGACLTGTLAAATAGALLGVPAVTTWSSVASSHAAAVVVMAPLLLLRAPATPAPGRPLEAAAQWCTSAALATAVFWPGQELPLTFLPLTALVWGAARLGTRTAAAQLLLLAVGASAAAGAGGGPLGAVAADSPGVAVSVTQLFLVCYAVVLVPLAMAMQQRRDAAAALHASEALFRAGFDEALVGMLVLAHAGDDDPVLRIVRANPVAARMLARGQNELGGTAWEDLVDPSERDVLRRALLGVLHDVGAWHGELLHSLGEDEIRRWMEVSVVRLPGPGGASVLSVQLADVTARREAEQRLRELALHDSLTGLPNRVLLTERVEQALRTGRRDGAGLALLFCDLDDFKNVNDSAGHGVGDALLVDVARRLEQAVRPGDTVARLGGDEFVVLCPGVTRAEAADRVAQRVIAALEAPVSIGPDSFRVGISIGVALSGPRSTMDALLREADVAMYASKAGGKLRATLFRAEHHEQAVRTVQLEAELGAGWERGELQLRFDPVVELDGGRVTGAQAVLCWRHPVRGLLPPTDFLDVVVASPLVHSIGPWLVQEACRSGAQWHDRLGPAAPAVHVVVPARQLERGHLARDVLAALHASELPPHLLVLELAGVTLTRLRAPLLAELAELAGRGVVLAVDGVAAGPGPLHGGTDLPVGLLALDAGLVSRLGADPRAAAVVRAVIGIGEALGTAVLARGVADPGQAQRLAELGCHTAQGPLWPLRRTTEQLADLAAGGCGPPAAPRAVGALAG